jgi:hypothetical protein
MQISLFKHNIFSIIVLEFVEFFIFIYLLIHIHCIFFIFQVWWNDYLVLHLFFFILIVKVVFHLIIILIFKFILKFIFIQLIFSLFIFLVKYVFTHF